MSRSEAFRAVQLILLRACKWLDEYHTKGPWMTMLVEAIEQLPSVDWDLLDDTILIWYLILIRYQT